MWNKTQFSSQFGLEYPIVQGPFGGGLSSVELSSTISNLGGLGSFGGQPYTAKELVEISQSIRKYSSRPFNINLWVNDHDKSLNEFGAEKYDKLSALFSPYFEELGLPVPERPVDLGPRFEEQVEAIFEAKPPVFSFVYGIPEPYILKKCKQLGIKTIGAATTVDEALALEAAGVDAVVATGFEAGGHRVSFLRPAEDSLTGTFALIPQVADRVKIPVIAAGGIADARGIRAALALGADAVQLGTAFLATRQSNATPDHRAKLFSPEARYTALTRIYTGRLSRGIVNTLIEDLKGKEGFLAPYPLQSKFMSHLKAYPATAESNPKFRAYWSGQAAGLLKYSDASDLFRALVAEMT